MLRSVFLGRTPPLLSELAEEVTKINIKPIVDKGFKFFNEIHKSERL